MKTNVEITNNDQYGSYKKGEKGYIDGYLRAADERPYAAVVVGKKVVLIQLEFLKVEVSNQTQE